MKRRDFSLALLVSLPVVSAFPSFATRAIRPDSKGIPRAPVSGQGARSMRVAVLGLGGNGSAAVSELRYRSERGELDSSYHLQWLHALFPTIKQNQRVISRYGEVPRELLRPMADRSWMTLNLQDVNFLIVLGNLSSLNTRAYLPGILVEAARLRVSTLVGVIEPWEVVGREVRRPDNSVMRQYISWLQKSVNALVVIQEDFARDAMLRLSALKDGDRPGHEASNALSTWNRAQIDKLAEVGRVALAKS